MRIELNRDFNESFICEIEENGGIVRWQYERNNRPDYVLIVQTPFGALTDISDAVSLMNERRVILTLDQTVAVTPEISCRLTTVAQGARGVFNVSVTPAVYSVYGCRKSDDTLTVYEEENKNHNRCPVSALIEYKADDFPVTIKKNFLWKKNETTYNFTKITLFKNKNYVDGALYYSFEDCDLKFPIGKHLVEKTFYVRWFNNEKRPVIRSGRDGYKGGKR